MKVLLATDGSKFAEEAGAFLAHLPHTERLELTILAVTPEFKIHGSIEVVEWVQRSLEEETGHATEACQRIARLFEGADARIEQVVIKGHVATSIVAEAKSRGCELIVLGAIGHSTIDRMLLGSVSDFVSTHAHCSVLLVRPNEIRESNRAGLNLCLAYDGSDPSKFAVKEVCRFGWGGRVHLDLVNVMPMPYAYLDIPIPIETDAFKADMTTTLNQVSLELASSFPNCKTHVLESPHVGDGVVRFATAHRVNLIVLGDTGHGLAGRFFLGSVSRYVLRHTRSSVWIARKRVEAAV